MKSSSSNRLIARAVAIFAMTICVMTALPCLASDLAVLKNGFTITHERREPLGTVTRLYISADGSSYVDVATAEIDHFEAAPDAPKPAIPPFAKNAKDGAPGTFNTASSANVAPSFPAAPVANLNDVVNDASSRYRLDPDLVNSVIKAESGFNVRAVSPKGAQGLMQLMPGTAAQLGVPNTFDAQQNVEGGTRYLRELLERYNFDLVKALAAYNAGPQRVEQYKGVPPYYETRAYVARIVKDFNKKKTAAKKSSGTATPAQSVAANQKPSAKTGATTSKTTNVSTHATTSTQMRASASKPAGN
jgi:soluble lytic murein transglycosylase-like protein